MFCALLNVFIISFFTRVRDGYISDLVSKWGVCSGVREATWQRPYHITSKYIDWCVHVYVCDWNYSKPFKGHSDKRTFSDQGTFFRMVSFSMFTTCPVRTISLGYWGVPSTQVSQIHMEANYSIFLYFFQSYILRKHVHILTYTLWWHIHYDVNKYLRNIKIIIS